MMKKHHVNQKCSQQNLRKTHKVLVDQTESQPNCYNLTLQTHDKNHFHYPKILKSDSGTHTEWILNRDNKKRNLSKRCKQIVKKTNCSIWNKFTFYNSIKPEDGTFVLFPNFIIQKQISKTSQSIREGPFQIIEKTTDVTFKLIDHNTRKRGRARNNLGPNYPKIYALYELTYLHTFTGLHIIENTSASTYLQQSTEVSLSDVSDKPQKQFSQKHILNLKLLDQVLVPETKQKLTWASISSS